jgi:hypothetical protein
MLIMNELLIAEIWSSVRVVQEIKIEMKFLKNIWRFESFKLK